MEKRTRSLSSEGGKTNGGNLIRSSTGQIITKPASSPITSEDNILPHYLRASTGSCHDFCKYGTKHTFESKVKDPVSFSFLKSDKQRKKENEMAKSKEKDVEQRPLTKLLSPPLPLKIKSTPKVVSGNQKDLVKMSASSVLCGGSGGMGYSDKKCISVGVSKTIGNKAAKQFGSLSLFSSPVHGNTSLKSHKGSSKTLATSKAKQKIESSSRETLVPKQGHASKPQLPNVFGDSSGEGIFKDIGISEVKEMRDLSRKSLSWPPLDHGLAGLESLKYQAKKAASSSLPSLKIDSCSKSLLASKQKPPVTKVSTSYSWKNSGGRTNSDKIPMDALLTKEKREVKPSPAFCLNSRATKIVRLGSKKYLNIKSGMHEYGEIKAGKELKSLGRDKRRVRSGSAICPEKKEYAAQHLKFRRGRVINVQSENNGLNRLRFKQRIAVENQDGKVDTGRRSFRRRRNVETNSSNNPATSVVLRHQDVQAKRDTQDFNQVIEETANKLVETKKSKVKALVGAFETVISLQESKPVTAC